MWFHIWFIMTFYYKIRQILKIATAILSQKVTKVYYKIPQLFYYKMRNFYSKMRQFIENATILLQNATPLTNCVGTWGYKFILKIDLSFLICQCYDTWVIITINAIFVTCIFTTWKVQVIQETGRERNKCSFKPSHFYK